MDSGCHSESPRPKICTNASKSITIIALQQRLGQLAQMGRFREWGSFRNSRVLYGLGISEHCCSSLSYKR